MAQDVIVAEEDCDTFEGITVSAIMEGGDILEPLRDRIVGRVAQEDVYDPLTGDKLVSQNDEITEELASAVQEAGIEQMKIRSVLSCETRRMMEHPVRRSHLLPHFRMPSSRNRAPSPLPES